LSPFRFLVIFAKTTLAIVGLFFQLFFAYLLLIEDVQNRTEVK
jgi:hypothetical protein